MNETTTVSQSNIKTEAKALAARLRRALQTGLNDDTTTPNTEQKMRFIHRCNAIVDAIEFLEGIGNG